MPAPESRPRRGDAAAIAALTAHSSLEVGAIASASVDVVRGQGTRVPWPAHTPEEHSWRKKGPGGTREDREFNRLTTMLPPEIATRPTPDLPAALVALVEEAVAEISRLDQAHGQDLGALGTLLLRSESVASSKIEQEEASIDDYARALHGSKANDSARSMAASTEALHLMICSVDGGQPIGVDAIKAAHRALMRDEPGEAEHAGKLRSMQNWIGGSDHSPRNALFVPPPPETVVRYMDDLVAYANRADIPVLPQAAIAHAQFESVHPFADGNGRIGRALINTVLRKRGATSQVVVPLASALVARRDHYFDVLGEYRSGDAGPIIAAFASASATAARESQVTAARITELPAQWAAQISPLQRGSAAALILAALPTNPFFSASEAEDLVGGAPSRVYKAIDRLVGAGIIRPLTDRKRNQIWGATDLLAELDDLGKRIEAAAAR